MNDLRCPRALPRSLSRRLLPTFVLVTTATLVPLARAAVTCSVSVPTLNFGIYDTVNTLSGNTTITVSCSKFTGSSDPLSYTLALSSGSGTYSTRTMSSGSNSLTYNIYISSNYQTVWGDGTGGTATVSGSVGSANPTALHTVYGRIVGGQNVVPGSYATVVPITVTMSF